MQQRGYHSRENALTLVEMAWPASTGLNAIGNALRVTILTVTGSLLIWLAAKIQIPFYPVPMTMSTFAVLAIGMAYGWRLGTATILLYLAEGAMGLPVFAGTPEKRHWSSLYAGWYGRLSCWLCFCCCSCRHVG